MSMPHLLYVYPWMPYPRRIIIYLRERKIPPSLVRLVACSDPQKGSQPKGDYPAPPHPGLPLLAIPPEGLKDAAVKDLSGWKILRQSLPIFYYLESIWISKGHFAISTEDDKDVFRSAISVGYQSMTEGALQCWNPVRNFASGVGPVNSLEAAVESLKWEHRELSNIEQHLDAGNGLDLDYGGFETRLSISSTHGPTLGDIMLFSFLEMVDDLYGCIDELTIGKRGEDSHKQGVDAYGREVQNHGFYPNIRKFYELFRLRDCSKRIRENDEDVPEVYKDMASKWTPGLF